MEEYRQQLLSKSILQAVFASDDGTKQNNLVWFRGLFALFDLRLARWRALLFKGLRSEVWQMEETEYKESFRLADRKGRLVSVGDLGYSGSVRRSPPFVVVLHFEVLGIFVSFLVFLLVELKYFLLVF